MSRDRFQRLDIAEGSNVLEVPEQEVTGSTTPSRAERIVSLLRSFGYLPDEDVDVVERAAAFGRGVAEGATGGWVDELVGGLSQAVPPETRAGLARLLAPEGQGDAYARAGAGLGYSDVRDAARRQQGAAAEAEPSAFIPGAVAGGVATGRMLPSAGAGLSGGSRVAARVAQAAGEGVIAGAGGSRADTVEGIAEDAALGGAIGGGISGGLAVVGGAGRALRAAQRGVEAVDVDAARAADLVTDVERIGSVIEDDRIRLKPATLRAIFAEAPPDPRALDATRGWFDSLDERIQELALDQGALLPQGRQALRNLRRVLNDQRVRFETSAAAGDFGEAFAAADQAKRSLGSAQGAAGRGANADRYAQRVMRDWYEEGRQLLENPAWGGGAAFQRAQNPAWTEYITRRRPYERFLEEAPERTPGGWETMQRASRPSVARVVRGGSDITQQDYVGDLVEGARSRATLTERLAHHEGSRLTPELTQQARAAADEIAAIAQRAQSPSLTRRIGQEIGDSTVGRRIAAVGDVAGQPLEVVGERASAATSRGVPSVVTASAATMPRAQPVAEDDDGDKILQMLGDEPEDDDGDAILQMLGD